LGRRLDHAARTEWGEQHYAEMSSALIFGNAPKQSVGEMLPMSSGRKVLKLARHDVQVRKFMTAPGLGPITALCFKATIRTASSDREVLAPMSDQEPGRTSIGSLPLDQWRHARVEAIEVQEVEGVVDHPFITVWLEVRVLPGPLCTEDWIRLDARQRLGNPAT